MAGKEVSFQCSSSGSSPTTAFSWFLGSTPLVVVDGLAREQQPQHSLHSSSSSSPSPSTEATAADSMVSSSAKKVNRASSSFYVWNTNCRRAVCLRNGHCLSTTDLWSEILHCSPWKEGINAELVDRQSWRQSSTDC